MPKTVNSIYDLIAMLHRIFGSEYKELIEQDVSSSLEPEDLEKVISDALSRQDQMEQSFNHLAYKPPFF